MRVIATHAVPRSNIYEHNNNSPATTVAGEYRDSWWGPVMHAVVQHWLSQLWSSTKTTTTAHCCWHFHDNNISATIGECTTALVSKKQQQQVRYSPHFHVNNMSATIGECTTAVVTKKTTTTGSSHFHDMSATIVECTTTLVTKNNNNNRFAAPQSFHENNMVCLIWWRTCSRLLKTFPYNNMSVGPCLPGAIIIHRDPNEGAHLFVLPN